MASVYYNRVLSDKMVNTIKDPKFFWIIDSLLSGEIFTIK